jgi:hypothetical protein
MRDEETDLSFADFGTEGVSRRLYPSPADGAAEDGLARPAEDVARREGELCEAERANPDPQVRSLLGLAYRLDTHGFLFLGSRRGRHARANPLG